MICEFSLAIASIKSGQKIERSRSTEIQENETIECDQNQDQYHMQNEKPYKSTKGKSKKVQQKNIGKTSTVIETQCHIDNVQCIIYFRNQRIRS